MSYTTLLFQRAVEADLPKHLLTVMALAPFFLDVIHGELQADDGRVSIASTMTAPNSNS
jgi:hypothetical protein